MHRLPNYLAVLRIVLAPVVVAFTLGGERLGTAAVLFFIAAATDFWDGYLARRWNVTSSLGAFLDTTADKLLVTGAFLALIAIDRVSVWAALIILMREFVVMALRSLMAVEGTLVPPSIWGKLKASTQFTAIFFAMLRLGDPIGGLFVDEWLMWAAVLITVLSGWGYVSAFAASVRKAAHRR